MSIALPASVNSSDSGTISRKPVVFLVTFLVMIYAVEVWHRRWLADDGMIVSRTVRELLAGNGPVFNPGERAEANTSTVWTYLVAAATWLLGVRDPGEVAVGLGLVCSVAGLAIGLAGTVGRAHPGRVLVPAGVLVVLALPPFWDFGTSGLETPLVFCWLGCCWFLLGRVTAGSRGYLAAFVFGLGWLVRPDLAVVSVVFLPALLCRVRPGRRRGAGLLATASALPVGYEIFRAGYYGMLVPLPAVAKDAGSADFGRGWAYLLDFVSPYHVWIAAVLVAIMVFGRRLSLPGIAAGIAGVASIGYVVAIGGDFMHARMLLPGVFLLLLPVAVVPLTVRTVAAGLALTAWAGICAVSWRPPYSATDPIGPAGIADERQFWVDDTGQAHPDRTADYFGGTLPSGSPPPGLTIDLMPGVLATTGGRSITVVGPGLGQAGARTPPNSTVVDRLGLSYPLAAHVQLTARGRPGHEKALPLVWVIADLATTTPRGVDPATVAAARHALNCGALAELRHAVRDPLTFGRFWANLAGAFARTELVVPADPAVAEHQFCG